MRTFILPASYSPLRACEHKRPEIIPGDIIVQLAPGADANSIVALRETA
ncbi:MAG: hypothetical protein IPH53_22850 [Flavobacteriales bacterium]|nr:hypothetical protein [Flavobacteriales bacterium]